MRLKMIFTIIASSVLTVFNVAAQDEKPLNLAEVEKALRSTKAAAASKNALLIEGVNTRKITFWLTAETERKLLAWGANKALLDAIRQNALPVVPMIQKQSKNLSRLIEVKNSIGMEFVLIPPGEFQMGAKKEDIDISSDGLLLHSVKIKQPFYIGKYEVTQAQWKLLMGANPSEFQKCGADCPIENIQWNEAKAFIKKLNEKKDGYQYRLPSEAEWEYAARGGAGATRHYWGDDPERKLWRFYAHHVELSPAKVGSYLPNAFGLYDVSGNVWEMCEDVWRDKLVNPIDDAAPNLQGDADFRVGKGGGWGESLNELRIAKRKNVYLESRSNAIGFRVVAIPN